MHHLVIVIIGIALTAALGMATINYLPWWRVAAADIARTLDAGLAQAEAAYQVAARIGDGIAPAAQPSADGGFQASFVAPILKFTPPAPPGYSWSYGDEGGGIHWFCLSSAATANVALIRAIRTVRSTRSPDQMLLNTGCGATSSMAVADDYSGPLAITYRVAYSPDIPR